MKKEKKQSKEQNEEATESKEQLKNSEQKENEENVVETIEKEKSNDYFKKIGQKAYKIKISDAVFENILIAIAIMIYFILINFAYIKIAEEALLTGLKILSTIVLIFSITVIEIAYKKDSGKIAVNGIELLVLAGYTLSIAHVVEAKKLEFANYILISSYVFSLYYLLKAIIVFTKERREYLKSLSDIREIVENNPTKKEATKKNKN